MINGDMSAPDSDNLQSTMQRVRPIGNAGSTHQSGGEDEHSSAVLHLDVGALLSAAQAK